MASKEKLNKGAAAATAKLFSGLTEPEKESVAAEAPVKEEKAKDKAVKQVFSFRGEKEAVKAWRLYATVTGTKVDDLGSLAMQEYLANHPLKGAEKALFDEKMK
jgi:hypothetical protein